jgi:hypothetical protein
MLRIRSLHKYVVRESGTNIGFGSMVELIEGVYQKWS